MGTTSNGKSWGHNTGRVASGFFYGWITMRGIKAAQRRGQRPDDPSWQPIATGVNVAGQWLLYAGLLIFNVLCILAAVGLTVAKFFPPDNPGNFDYVPPTQAHLNTMGITAAVLAIPYVIALGVAIMAGRALVARAEGLRPRRGERVLTHFKHTWTAWLVLCFAPGFIAGYPFFTALSRK